MTGITKAIQKVGSAAALAEKLGTTRQVVEYWERCEIVPPGWVFAVFDVTAVPLHELNPKIYPKNRVRIV